MQNTLRRSPAKPPSPAPRSVFPVSGEPGLGRSGAARRRRWSRVGPVRGGFGVVVVSWPLSPFQSAWGERGNDRTATPKAATLAVGTTRIRAIHGCDDWPFLRSHTRWDETVKPATRTSYFEMKNPVQARTPHRRE